jgi:alkylation response protein AidB-like acyl-CoA dehydrogenase
VQLALTPEQELIRNTVREFSKKEVGPRAAEWDRTRAFPWDAFRKLGPLGLLGALIPPDHGGSGLDKVSYLLALEELAYGDPGFSVGVAVHTSVAATPIVWYGSDEQKRRFLPRLASGETVGAFAVTEPQGGSDVASIQTRAERQGDHYVVNGTKVFITNGSHAKQTILAARTGSEDPKASVSLFVVERDTPGYEVGAHEEKLGLHSSDTASLSFTDMKVPAANRLGAEGDGFKMLMRILNSSRLGIAAQSLGLARRALDESVKYAKERKAFGSALAKHQAIQFMVADMATRIEAARLLTFRAAAEEDRGELRPEHASMAKLLASEMAVWVAEKAVQIHGGNGYIKDYVVERLMRDAPVTRIYEGTNEVQKLIVARALARQ